MVGFGSAELRRNIKHHKKTFTEAPIMRSVAAIPRRDTIPGVFSSFRVKQDAKEEKKTMHNRLAAASKTLSKHEGEMTWQLWKFHAYLTSETLTIVFFSQWKRSRELNTSRWKNAQNWTPHWARKEYQDVTRVAPSARVRAVNQQYQDKEREQKSAKWRRTWSPENGKMHKAVLDAIENNKTSGSPKGCFGVYIRVFVYSCVRTDQPRID